MSITRKPSKLELAFILSPIRLYIKQKYNISVGRNDTIELKGPYLVLSNHVNNWDPLFINSFVEEPLCFVAAAPLFKHSFVKRVLDYAGAISKTKLKNDMSTIRNMIKAKKYNRSIALFHEGNRNWNGHADESIYATAKLVKMLNIPVVVTTIKGGYLSNPRWADSIRKGKIEVSFEKVWDIAQINELTVEQIHEQLNKRLVFDEVAWNEQEQVAFHGKALANYLERYLFVCPSCEHMGTLHSYDDTLGCSHCQYKVRYNVYGSLDQLSEHLHFKYLKDWNDWQMSFIANRAHTDSFNKHLKESLKEEVTLLIAEHNEPYKKYGISSLKWTDNGIVITTQEANKSYTISFLELEGLNVHMHNKLDFFYGDKLFRLNFHNPRTSAYKWQKLIYLYQANKEDANA